MYQANLVVYRFKNQVAHFLTGITSNELESKYNAFLDKQGRIIATYYQLLVGDDELLAAVSPHAVDRLQEHLKNYLLLADTELNETNLRVWVDLDKAYDAKDDEHVISLGACALVMSPHDIPANVDEQTFTRFRVDHGLPLHGIDFDREMLLNVSDVYVSFDKGCFVGQEIVARVHYKSKPPKKLVVVTAGASDPVRDTMTSVCSLDSGQIKGFALVPNK